RIDYFFVNSGFSEKVVNAEIHEEVMGSDHCPISLTLEL
ncbi:MAG TPA: exodeoxyribonuclease III, partial [Candidatus Marinimicrobia bacterium]|nr:exodeoxyribonuclease III [Candidatus Neomarinimicrobiota bacterium]